MKPNHQEIEQQLSESRREFLAADATINNLELKLAEMVAQLDNTENKCAVLLDELDKWKQESSVWQAVAEKQLALATNAEQKIAELESLTAPKLPQQALAVPDEMTPKQASRSYCGEVRGYRDGWNACRAAMLHGGSHYEQHLDMVDHSGDITKKSMLHVAEPGNFQVTPGCWCRTCRPVKVADMRFVVCPECGNKRCPHANDHRNACTGSNEPGQEGSAYPASPQKEVNK